VADLVRTYEGLDDGSTILDLQLSGGLSAAERTQLTAEIDRLRPGFLNLADGGATVTARRRSFPAPV